jgi:hypothetical protein
MPTHADFLRLKAEECRAIADLFHNGAARSQLLIVAEQYERLADQYDRAGERVTRVLLPKPSV